MNEENGNVDYSDNFDTPEETIDFFSMNPITLPIDKEFHIFISYKTVEPDRLIALKIDKLLRSKGFKCCLHERDFLPGDLIVHNIVQNIERSVKVLFLLSEQSRASEWCQFELNVTETIHIQERGYKPIILKLDECDLPDTMKRYTYLPAVSPPEKWIGRLSKAINDQTDHLITNRRNIKFVPVPCIDYNRNKEHSIVTCRYPHVCVKYIVSDESCDGSCGKNHDLVTDQSREILVDLGFITDGNLDALLQMYRQKCKEKLAAMPNNIVTGPCCYYNHKGCLLGDFHCPFTHICKDWFVGICKMEKCRFSHHILNDHTKKLLEIFEIDTDQEEDIIFNTYRAKYPHKKFIQLPSQTISKTTFLKDNWLPLVGGVLTVVGVTAFVVKKI
ncbi:uncharacterized protein LOC127719855 isoform X5 [Mytilus californianus]|uniref:uncharacterized protein LOC127719855 isoform X4 n=1 Tax=Mytilus californianus TaxID=6549 RepID=UPI0022476F31|nr:uncharacterized protein LOC127719855 isoform X4 [Mytilus californianus]XP_052082152.1 uncharacterized protein LOC127719855 isoform X5 [Mytilus californianus]